MIQRKQQQLQDIFTPEQPKGITELPVQPLENQGLKRDHYNVSCQTLFSQFPQFDRAIFPATIIWSRFHLSRELWFYSEMVYTFLRKLKIYEITDSVSSLKGSKTDVILLFSEFDRLVDFK